MTVVTETCGLRTGFNSSKKSGALMSFAQSIIQLFRSFSTDPAVQLRSNLGLCEYYEKRGREAGNGYRKHYSHATEMERHFSCKRLDFFKFNRIESYMNAVKCHQKVLEADEALTTVEQRSHAMFRLGMIRLSKRDYRVFEETARSYIRQAAEANYVPAMMAMARFAAAGSCGFERDLEKAVGWCNSAYSVVKKQYRGTSSEGKGAELVNSIVKTREFAKRWNTAKFTRA